MKNILQILIFFTCWTYSYGEIPEGFEKKQLSHSDSSFLIPKEWKTKSNSADVLDVYLFSPEVKEEDFAHDMGLLVMIYKGIEKNSGSVPSAVARDIKGWVINSRKGTLIESGPKDLGPFHGAIAIHESTTHRFHEMHLGIDEKDRLWMITFSSPKESWDSNWANFGFPIFKNIILDDEY